MGPEKCIGPFHLGLDRIDGNPVGFGYFGIALAVDDKGNEDFPSFVRHPIEQFNDFIVLSWLFRMGLVVLLDNFELRMKDSGLFLLFKMEEAQVFYRLPCIGLKRSGDLDLLSSVPKGNKQVLYYILCHIAVLYNGVRNKT